MLIEARLRGEHAHDPAADDPENNDRDEELDDRETRASAKGDHGLEEVERVVRPGPRPLEDDGIRAERGVVRAENERDLTTASDDVLHRDAFRARYQARGDARAPDAGREGVVRQHLEAIDLRGERAGSN